MGNACNGCYEKEQVHTPKEKLIPEPTMGVLVTFATPPPHPTDEPNSFLRFTSPTLGTPPLLPPLVLNPPSSFSPSLLPTTAVGSPDIVSPTPLFPTTTQLSGVVSSLSSAVSIEMVNTERKLAMYGSQYDAATCSQLSTSSSSSFSSSSWPLSNSGGGVDRESVFGTQTMAVHEFPSSAVASTIVRGSVQCTFAVIDDRRRQLANFIAPALFVTADYGGTPKQNVLYIIIEYVGCLVCRSKPFIEYTKTHLPHGTCHPVVSDCLDHKEQLVQPQWNVHCTINNDQVIPNIGCLRSRVLAIEKRITTDRRRTWCRYCGLSLYHHLGNRERRPWVGYDEQDRPFVPQQWYCEMRCPIHLCLQCKQPFVKVETSHLCAHCLYEDRTAVQPPGRRFWRSLVGVNNYRDEIEQNVILPTMTKMVARVVSGKHGTHTVHQQQTRISSTLGQQATAQFLDRTEYHCCHCQFRFRLNLVQPATILFASVSSSSSSSASSSSSSSLTTSASSFSLLSLSNETLNPTSNDVPMARVDSTLACFLPNQLCGFCF